MHTPTNLELLGRVGGPLHLSPWGASSKWRMSTARECITRAYLFHQWSCNYLYYMTSSVSGQDEPNRPLWLATRAGKMKQSCPLGKSRSVPQDQRSFFGVLSHIINPLLIQLVLSRWLDIGLVLFLRVHKRAKKERGQYPAILTERAWSITHIYWHHRIPIFP